MNDDSYFDAYELSKERSKLDEHDEESYCNWEIKRNKKLFTTSPNADAYVSPVSHSESLAKELKERERQFELEKHSRLDILKLLRE
jgi:hypothetical protein